MSLSRYPEYKDSGVEWLGEVPRHWVARKIGAIASLKGRLGWQGLTADEYRDDGPYVVSSAHFDDNKIQWEACPRVSQERYDADSNIQLAANDVLLMKDGAAMGKLAFVESLPGPACLNSHLLLFRPVNVGGDETFFPRFAFYYMQTGYFQEYIKVNGTGATFLGISQDAIGRYQIPLPPNHEQQTIATFLDRETGKIDALIAEQQRLVELLAEKRQAVISHAVTKGLNTNAPMKDSGIEWLGEVPEHWEVKPIKAISTCNDEVLEESTPTDYEIEYIEISGVDASRGIAETSIIPFGKAPSRARRRVKDGDVLVSTVRTYLRAIAPVNNPPVNMIASTGFAVIRPRNVVPGFLGFLFQAEFLIAEIIARSVGVSYPAINASDLMRLNMPVPSWEEQSAIAIFLDNETAKFDTLTAEASRAITLLQERRSALISAAVTGKIDVRAT